MKFSALCTLLMIALCLTACGDKESATSTTTPTATSTTVAPTTSTSITPPATQAPATVNIPAGDDGIVHHYICPDQCAGGVGAAAGSCPVCGKVMSHNQAFHSQGQAAQATTTTTSSAAPGQIISAPSTSGNGKPSIDVTNPGAQNLTIPPPTAEPAQNAQGVWHYTCANGCAGGAGSATACASCGSTLAHNAVYHQ